ncbi:hypothetical protein ACFX1Z_018507 [Malus domestica]
MIAKVEPLVNMGQITRVTVPLNLAFAVVAEFDDLTVGGLINGYGIEGSSHIYGLFSDTVVAYDFVLTDGRVVRATRDNEYFDIFYAIPYLLYLQGGPRFLQDEGRVEEAPRAF